MAVRSEPIPGPFRRVVKDLRAFRWRAGMAVEEIPSPQRIAPHAVALNAEVSLREADLGGGRLVLLHDPHGVDAWGGTFRVVAYAKGQADPEMVTDTMLADVGWSWLLDALTTHEAEYDAAGGNVNCSWSRSFGELEDDDPHAEIEVRASWTPLLGTDGSGIGAHLSAFADLLCATCGVPPLPEGVVRMAPLHHVRPQGR